MLTVGELVVSTAGRDSNTRYLVVETKERFASVCDGGKRSLTRPKRKNLRHLRSCGKVAADIGARLSQGEKVEDSEIRESIAALSDTEGDELSDADIFQGGEG